MKKMVGSLTEAWADQHNVYPGDQWAREMWNGFLDPQRIQLVKAIQRAVETPGSILEVGCGSGPNLRLCHAVWPSADLTGVDVNQEGIAWGMKKASEEGWNWWGYPISIDRLGYVEHPRDVVITCYTLAYLDPTQIESALRHLLRLTRKALVIMEPMVGYGKSELLYQGQHVPGGVGYPELLFDYLTRLGEVVKSTGLAVNATIEPITPWGRLNGVVTVVPTGTDASHTSRSTDVASESRVLG